MEEELDVLVVGDDAVVDHDELVVLAGGVRMRVHGGRNTVSSPSERLRKFNYILNIIALLNVKTKLKILDITLK